MKKLIRTIVAATALLAGSALAGETTAEQARTVAENFVTKDSIGQSVLSGRTVDTVLKRGGFYLVTLKPAGHLFVSVNRSARPIPVFSETDFAEPATGSPQAAFLAAAETNALNATGTQYETQWKTLLGQKVLRLKSASTSSTSTYVAPLLAASWSQDAPYYDFAPANPANTGAHEPNGCVATAFGQIMRYWEWPEAVDEDFSTEHTVDSVWGFKQQLWAGTKLYWSDMPISGYSTETDRINIGRGIMLCGMLAKMGYAYGGSASQNKDVARNPWYTVPNGLDCDGTNADALKAAIMESLNAKCPILVGIGSPNHSIVCDGCSESGGTFYIHLNYGWGGTSTQNYALDYTMSVNALSSIYHSQRPKPMVLVDSMAAESTLPLTLKWSFPKKGYEDGLTGFTIQYAEVDSNVYDWQDDFSSQQGTIDGADVAVETISCDNETPVLNVRNTANQVHYTWPAKVLGADSKLSFRIRSNNAIGMKIVVQAYNPSTGWETICIPALAEKTVSDWQEIVLPLPQYADKAVGLRVGAQRVSLQGASGHDDIGVQFDDFKITNVRNVASPTSIEVGRDIRNYSFAYSELTSGKNYAFTVNPKVEGGVVSPAVSTKIVVTAERATIDAIASVRNTGYQVQQGFYREGYLGLNQFGVYGSEATTGLVVRLSHPSLIDKSTPYFDTVDQKWGVTFGATSVVHAVSVEKVRNGKFLVKLDFDNLTEFLRYTRMMVTFDALDAKGNVARKHFNLLLNNLGGETAITKDQLPDYGGSAPEPDPVYYTVSFNANGGTGGERRQILSGSTIGSFPVVSYTGHTLKGWFDQTEGGTQIYESQQVTGNATYYAQWNENTTPGGDEPGGGEPVDDGKTRFCHGVSTTSGWFDTKKPSYYNNYVEPIAVNLVKWWAEQYKAANGAYPAGYVVIPDSALDHASSDTIANLTTALAGIYLASISDRTTCFPTAMTSADSWYSSETAMAVEAGARIYEALAKGPIGYKTTLGYGVIWGCDYATDTSTGVKYATKVYVTDTRKRDTSLDTYEFKKCYDYSDYNTGTPKPGFYNFTPSQSLNAKIEAYYPIVGPAGSGGGDDEPTTKTFIVTFNSDGGSAVNAQSVEDGKSLVSIPTPTKSGYTFDGWFNGNEQLTTATKITANVTYAAHWTEIVIPPVDPDEPVTPVDPAEGKIGVASNVGDPGNFYTQYDYTMNDNYWTARKLAIQQRKQLFILSGAAWCSNCSFVKDYLNSKAAQVSANFIVYFSDHDSYVCNYFNGGLPQYGAADPRTVDAFTGTLNGEKRSWALAWQKSTSGIYVQDRGGYAPERVQTVIDTGIGKAKIGSPTNLVIRGLSTLATGYAGKYELYAQFDDGVEMPVDHGVTWSVVSGNGNIVEAGVEGRDIGKLTINSGSVVIRAESTFYFTGYRTMTVAGADIGSVKSVAILTDSVNLEDDATPLLEAIATMNDDSTIPVAGFGDWSAVFKSRIERDDPELEESNQSPSISFDENSRLVYAQTNGKLEVCDQKIDVTLTLNGKTTTKEVTVWGPTKVAPSKWKMISGPRQTALGVVRLQCTELKYNYGGKILTTTDTYFASYKTLLKYASSSYPAESFLRGLTAASTSVKGENCQVALTATKVNGKYSGYSPAEPFASDLATNFTNVAKGATVTDIEHGEVPTGFFNAFWPTACAGKTTDELKEFALEDSDGDSFANWEEYVLGTDPTNASDAFTLMQGYQHLTAPAANGDTMQYKVMYQQRARRLYFIDAKSSWGDANWTQVAKVSLANMEEADVTKFTELNANYADNAKFFRVRAALYEHEFMHMDDCPKIETKMLVANRDSLIDLTNEALPLNFSSFDTDATDPGTVYVKVPANIAKGTVLITAPTVARSSLEACRPKDRTDIAFEVVESSGRLALRVAGDEPFVKDGKGLIEIVNDQVIVTPNANETDIALVNVGERTVVIPSNVDRIAGVADSRKLVIKSGTYDVTQAMKFTSADGGIGIDLDAETIVTIGDEKIPVRPVLAEGKGEMPFEVQDGQCVFKVKSIPGLKYQVLASGSLDPDSFTPAGKECEATGTRRELTVTRPEPKGFFKVRVSR